MTTPWRIQLLSERSELEGLAQPNCQTQAVKDFSEPNRLLLFGIGFVAIVLLLLIPPFCARGSMRGTNDVLILQQQIKKSMTRDQVFSIAGKPDKSFDSPFQDDTQQWLYFDKNGRGGASIILTKGKVVEITLHREDR